MASNASSLWVVVPAFNEATVIAQVLEELTRHSLNVVVVDDGSSDGTAQEALEFPVTLLRHVINLGQGAALQTGLQYVLSQPEAEYVATFDADGQHRVSDLLGMLAVCREGGYDIVLGSRFLPGGQAQEIDVPKRIALKVAVVLTRVMTGLPLTDTHNGLRVLTVKAAGGLRITQNGMAHASEILSQIARHRLRYCEVPVMVRYSDYSRRKGQSIWNGINILIDLLEGFLR